MKNACNVCREISGRAKADALLSRRYQVTFLLWPRDNWRHMQSANTSTYSYNIDDLCTAFGNLFDEISVLILQTGHNKLKLILKSERCDQEFSCHFETEAHLTCCSNFCVLGGTLVIYFGLGNSDIDIVKLQKIQKPKSDSDSQNYSGRRHRKVCCTCISGSWIEATH